MTHQPLRSCLALCLALSAAPAAWSQTQPPSDDGVWRYSLGLGAISQPRYPGSADLRTRVLPMFSASAGRFFLGAVPGSGVPVGLGYHLVQDGPWRFGLSLGGQFEAPRRASDAQRLAGWGDIGRTAFGSAFGSYSQQAFSLRAALLSDVGGNQQGTRAMLDLDLRFSPVEGLLLHAGPGLTWADARYTQTFFGVTTSQALRSGLPTYGVSGGLHALRWGMGAEYQVGPQWGVGARWNVSSLQRDAANSPLTDKKAQSVLGLFANHRF